MMARVRISARQFLAGELAWWRARHPRATRLTLIACWVSACGIAGLALSDLIVAWRAL